MSTYIIVLLLLLFCLGGTAARQGEVSIKNPLGQKRLTTAVGIRRQAGSQKRSARPSVGATILRAIFGHQWTPECCQGVHRASRRGALRMFAVRPPPHGAGPAPPAPRPFGVCGLKGCHDPCCYCHRPPATATTTTTTTAATTNRYVAALPCPCPSPSRCQKLDT